MTTVPATATTTAPTTRAPRRSSSDGHALGAVLRYLGIAAALIFALFPIWFIVAAAVNPAGTISTTELVPAGVSGANYEDLTAARPYWSWYKNTLIIAGFGSLAAVFLGVLAAYAFSRLRFAGRRPGLMALLLIQMFPSLLTFVALYRIFVYLGDVIPALGFNTALGLIAAYLGGAMGANVWLLKGYFDTVPKELDEAAKVDGASHARIFFTITLPLITPILVTVGMIQFIGLVNEFLLASIFLKDVDAQTLGVGLWGLLEADRNRYFGAFCVGALLASIPVVLLYLTFQKQLVGGLTSGSVK
ncbi:MAG TPA: ABC transporter permease subunit [Dermatophilaceae bacterium]|nr:ABC transporter permease subunit [Dermatophilaceae bacterium]